MNGKSIFITRWVSIFIIFIGAAGMFSSVWNGISDTIFYEGSLVPSTQCYKYSNAGTTSENFESVNDFIINSNGTRYECHGTSYANPQFQNLKYQVPGIFSFGLIVAFGVLLYRYTAGQQKIESHKS